MICFYNFFDTTLIKDFMMKPSLLLSMVFLFLSATAQKKNKIDPMVEIGRAHV